jgi:hypothetical protein
MTEILVVYLVFLLRVAEEEVHTEPERDELAAQEVALGLL